MTKEETEATKEEKTKKIILSSGRRNSRFILDSEHNSLMLSFILLPSFPYLKPHIVAPPTLMSGLPQIKHQYLNKNPIRSRTRPLCQASMASKDKTIHRFLGVTCKTYTGNYDSSSNPTSDPASIPNKHLLQTTTSSTTLLTSKMGKHASYDASFKLITLIKVTHPNFKILL